MICVFVVDRHGRRRVVPIGVALRLTRAGRARAQHHGMLELLRLAQTAGRSAPVRRPAARRAA